MLKKIFLMTCVLALSTAPVLAQHGDEEGPMGPPPGLMIPLPADFMPPPPEDGPEEFMKAALSAIDTDGDKAISGDEIKAAMEGAMAMMEEGGDMPPPPPEGEMGPPPFPHIVIPVPGDFMPPPPEDGHKAFMKAAFDAIDTDGDGALSKDEIKAAMEGAMHDHEGGMDDHEGPMGDHDGTMGDHESGMDGGEGPMGDHDGTMHDHDGTMDGGMDPEWEMAECNGAEGNHVIRELVASAGSNAVAISLPAGRAAGCFEVSGGDYEAEILEETDPPSDPAPVAWSSDSGDAIADLVLGEGIFHFQLASDDGASITVSYVDYPVGE